MAATPAQIRRQRKNVLRKLSKSLRDLDSILEQSQRKVTRVLKLKRQFPDSEDAVEIAKFVKEMDGQLEKVTKSLSDFAKEVTAF